MSTDDPARLLSDRVREFAEARKLEDPRIQAMIADVRLIRTEIRGMNQSGNLALGNSREAVEDVKCLREIVMVQADTIIGLQNELISVRAELAAVTQRVERMADWINAQVDRSGKPSGKKQ